VRRCFEGRLAIAALIAFAAWIFVALPLYYGPRDDTAPAKCSSKEEKDYGFWEKTRCDPATYFTAWLVGFTGVLAISTIGLWVVTWLSGVRQSRDMEASIAAAHRSADIAEKALLSVEIPYLYPVIRKHGFVINHSTLTGQMAITNFDFGTDFLEYYFRNFGRSPAEITEVQSILVPKYGMPVPYPAGLNILAPLSGQIAPPDGGDSQDFRYMFSKGDYEAYWKGERPPRLEILNFWFLGFVRYNDVFENEYVRGFCLQYSPMTNRFYPVGGDGYNYRKKTKSGGQPLTEQTPT
jgi:hypothetical protein